MLLSLLPEMCSSQTVDLLKSISRYNTADRVLVSSLSHRSSLTMLWGLRSTILNTFVEQPRRFFLCDIPALVPALVAITQPGIQGGAIVRNDTTKVYMSFDDRSPIHTLRTASQVLAMWDRHCELFYDCLLKESEDLLPEATRRRWMDFLSSASGLIAGSAGWSTNTHRSTALRILVSTADTMLCSAFSRERLRDPLLSSVVNFLHTEQAYQAHQTAGGVTA